MVGILAPRGGGRRIRIEVLFSFIAGSVQSELHKNLIKTNKERWGCLGRGYWRREPHSATP